MNCYLDLIEHGINCDLIFNYDIYKIQFATQTEGLSNKAELELNLQLIHVLSLYREMTIVYHEG